MRVAGENVCELQAKNTRITCRDNLQEHKTQMLSKDANFKEGLTQVFSAEIVWVFSIKYVTKGFFKFLVIFENKFKIIIN